MELKTLISLYVRIKLKENGLLPNEQLPEQEDLEKEILSATLEICSEIEHDARFPEILAPFRSYGIELEIFSTVVEQLLDDGLNWPRVMSVVSLVAALAVECMERGDLHKIDLIQDWASAFSEERVNPWIESNGGLIGIVKFVRRQNASTESKTTCNHWERNLAVVGTVGLMIGLFVASKA